MVISFKRENEFVPEWNKNKDEDKPIKVLYREPTMALKEKLIDKPKIEVTYNEKMESDGGKSVVVVDNTNIVKKMVTKIENLEIDVDGKKRQLTTADDLFGDVPSELSGLVDEIGNYLQGVLLAREVDTKN